MESVDLSKEKTVLLETYDTDFQAQLVKGLLEDNGIPSVITGSPLGVNTPIFPTSTPGVKLLVFEKDYEEAKTLLASAGEQKEDYVVEETAEEETPKNHNFLVCFILIIVALGLIAGMSVMN